MQSALGEGNREGDDSYANLEDRDKETDVLGVSLQMLETAADFLLGPRERFPEYDEWLAIEKAEKEQHWKRVKELEGDPQVVVAVRPGKADRQEGRWRAQGQATCPSCASADAASQARSQAEGRTERSLSLR